ncbi:MAG: flavocytochrome c [Firmicutes bacterium]|nr:flavocytochrome c [Bacillota bacterium]
MNRYYNRRDFVKGFAVGGAALASGIMLSGCNTGSADINGDIKWDEETDVVIIGSGFASCAAAIEAKTAGSSVRIFEKMDMPGGNSAICGGGLAVAHSPLHDKFGVKDSPELLLEDMLKAGLNLNDVEKARMVAEKSVEISKWYIEFLGVKYLDHLVQDGGHSVPRILQTESLSGSGILNPMLDKLKGMGVSVETNKKMNRIIKGKDGRVVGIEIAENYKFDSDSSSGSKYIKAKKALVLGGGGFAANVAFRCAQDPRLTEELMCTNHEGATGDAMIAAMSINAMPVQLDQIQLGPWGCPDEKGFGLTPLFIIEGASQWGIYINPTTGKRFVSEMGDRKQRTDAMIAQGTPAILLIDSVGIEKINKDLVDRILNKTLFSYNSVEELAGKYKIPQDALKETLSRYNSFIANGEDLDFKKLDIKNYLPIEKPPFYAVRLWPKIHHCMGGIMVNKECQVMNLDSKVIPGLYAAGEIASGTHGACRLGGCGILDALVCGRLAGQNASKETPLS